MPAATLLEFGVARVRATFTDILVHAGGHQYGTRSLDYARRLASGLVDRGARTAWITDSGLRQELREEYLRDLGGHVHHLNYTAATIDGHPGGVLLTCGDPLQNPIGFMVAPDRAAAAELARATLAEHPDYFCIATSAVDEQSQRGLSLLDLIHWKDGAIRTADMQATRQLNLDAAKRRAAERERRDNGEGPGVG